MAEVAAGMASILAGLPSESDTATDVAGSVGDGYGRRHTIVVQLGRLSRSFDARQIADSR